MSERDGEANVIHENLADCFLRGLLSRLREGKDALLAEKTEEEVASRLQGLINGRN